jgi:hypothetical protein
MVRCPPWITEDFALCEDTRVNDRVQQNAVAAPHLRRVLNLGGTCRQLEVVQASLGHPIVGQRMWPRLRKA